MRISALLALLAAAPVFAQTRVAPVTAVVPAIGLAAPALSAPIPGLTLSGLSLSPSPSLSAALTPAAALVAAPIPIIVPAAVRPAIAVPLPAKVAALNAEAAKVVASLSENPASGSAAASAGRDLEALLTGAPLSAPSAADAAAAPEELAFAVGASQALAARADELGAAKGLKARSMTGAQFLAVLDEARGSGAAAPTPAAAAAVREIEAAVVRFARALIPADKPVANSLPRALAVWQVFDQEMGIAASKGTLGAIVDDAKLFASQVEDSVEPKTTKVELALAPAEVHPEDPNGYASVAVEGSIFGWQPIERSPNHGFAPLDALIRKVLGEKKSGYEKGFELAGAAKREDARIHFYGERHTDGELISANMKRLVADARPGEPVIVLVEGYTGWALRGWPALKYLADRGLEPDELTDKVPSGLVELRGWDAAGNYDDSKHPLLQHHMDQLAMNHLAHGELRGWRYYREMARAALTAWRSYRELWRAAIVVRNGDLNAAVSKAAADAEAQGGTVHVIAGTDHLMENPRLSGLPLIGRPSFRKTLRDALGGRPFWASQPPNTQK